MGNKKSVILVINNGSTSTKLSIFEDTEEIIKKEIKVTPEDVKDFKDAMDQREFRTNMVLDFLKEKEIDPKDLSIVAARAGALPPIQSGAYLVNDLMVDVLERFPTMQHANNLSAIIAYDIATAAGINAVVYDGDTMDEALPEAKVIGLADIKRVPTCHALNMKSVARVVAKKMDRSYESVNFIIAHLGGGISLSAHRRGRIIDYIFDDEGPLAPQRSGRVPASTMINLCFSGKHTKEEMHRMVRGQGGLLALTGSQDILEIEQKVELGDEAVKEAYYAMAYQVAKGIGELSVTLRGKVDRIILTGGIANSKKFTSWISEMVEFIAPIAMVPGEREMVALATGALKVLKGEEVLKDYDIKPSNYVLRN